MTASKPSPLLGFVTAVITAHACIPVLTIRARVLCQVNNPLPRIDVAQDA